MFGRIRRAWQFSAKRHALGRRVATASSLIVALVFSVSGTTKLLSPSGTIPLVFIDISGVYPVLLRSLGLAELLLAAMVVWPRTRIRGLVVAAASLLFFSTFVAWYAADFSFVGNCGCFGGLDLPSGYYLWLVLRNSMAVMLAALGVALATRTAGMRAALIWATVVSAFAMLAPVVIGEMRLRAHSYNTIAAILDAGRFDGFQGRSIPPFDLFAAGGQRVSTAEAFQPGDQLVFVSRSCPHCRTLGPELALMQSTLSAKHRRLVLVMIDTAEVPPDWPDAIGCTDLPVFATRDRLAVARLGVTSVPRFITLGEDKEVVFNESYPLAASFWKSLDLIERRVDGVANEVWNQIAARIFGVGAKCDHRPEVVAGVGMTEVSIGQAGAGKLVIVHESDRPGDAIEMALGFDARDHIVDVVPLSAGAYIRTFFPDLAFADSLRGLGLAEAESLTTRNLPRSRLELPVWRSLRQGLRRLRDAKIVSLTDNPRSAPTC